MAFRTNKTPVLQEKSASGAVATFNTALAMPLPSCKIAVNAWQEGSGEPSPDNVRNFVGYSEININACGVNIVSIADKASSTENGITSEITNSKLVASGQSTGNGDIKVLFNKPLIIKQGMTIYFSIDGTDNRSSLLFVFLHRKGGSYLSPTSIPNTSHSITLTTEGVYDYMLLRTTINQTVNIDAYIMIGTSAEYVPYVGSYKTINLGGTYYFGEYDARTGVLTVTHELSIFDGSEDWRNDGENTGRYLNPNWAAQRSIPDSNDHYQNICPTATNWAELNNSNNACYFGQSLIYKVDKSLYPTVADFKNFLSQNNLQLLYPLPTPTTIQLPPCPIDTLEGVNNIWADTGDIDLTYKDLDIAKRGNFREVFKLPS